MSFQVIVILCAEAVFALALLKSSGVLDSVPKWIASLLLLAAAFILRGAVLSYQTLDYQDFLSKWVEYYRINGGFAGLAHSVGNYNIPYLYFLALFSYCKTPDLYLIKLLSIFFDVLLAWSVLKLTGIFTCSKARQLVAFFIVLFLPTVVLNGSLWGQCDSIYVALILMGLWFALDDRPCLSVIFAALSFGFKLQAVFILPVWAVLLLRGKIQWKHVLLFPLTYVILVLPAVLIGRPFLDTITLYFNQTGSIGSGLNYNSSSVYALVNSDDTSLSVYGIIAAAVYMIVLLIAALVFRKRLTDRSTLILTALFAVGIPFFLPHMHDRYFFGADILTVVLACGIPPVMIIPALLTQFASLLGYHAYLKMRFFLLMDHGARALILAMIFLLAALIYELVRPEKADGMPLAAAEEAKGNKLQG